MQRIHLIKQQESIKKVSVLYNVDVYRIKQGSRKIDGREFYVLNGYDDGIYIIENYNKPFIFKVENQTKQQLSAMGYEISDSEIEQEDIVLLSAKKGKKHIVRPLEKLDDIANFYAIPKTEIVNRNNLKTEKLYIGQILWI